MDTCDEDWNRYVESYQRGILQELGQRPVINASGKSGNVIFTLGMTFTPVKGLRKRPFTFSKSSYIEVANLGILDTPAGRQQAVDLGLEVIKEAVEALRKERPKTTLWDYSVTCSYHYGIAVA